MTTFWATMLLQTPKNPRFCAKVFSCKTLLNMARIRIWDRNFGSTTLLIDLFIPCNGGGGGRGVARLLWPEEGEQNVGWLHLHWSASNPPHICRSAGPAHEKNKKKKEKKLWMNYRTENISDRMKYVRNKYLGRLKTCPVSGTYRNC